MTAIANVVLLVYGLLMLAGGIIGYRAAGSWASLISGLLSGIALLGTWVWARSNPPPAHLTAAGMALLLCIVFALRFAKTGKFMPPGMLLVMSVVALVVVAIAGLRGE